MGNLVEYYGFTEEESKKYPIVNAILMELTPERIKRINKEVSRIRLPPIIRILAREYENIGDRNEYLWKWIYKGCEVFTDKSMSPKYLHKLLEAKVILFMFDTLLDDVSDKFKDKKLLEEMLKIPYQRKNLETSVLNKNERKQINFAIRLWQQAQGIIKEFPRYKEFKDLFDYDFSQLLNALRYSELAHNNKYLLNPQEGWLYFPHVMLVVANVTLELMCLFSFEIKELGKVREFSLYAQRMSRIGNWISTWEREIEEEDFTSAVFAYAVANNIITPEELYKDNKEKIIEIIREAKIEKELLKEWEENYWKINKLSKSIRSFNVNQKLYSLRKVLFYHLSSRGYK